jgi:transcriptional pleiotropic regulator of transition state genes
MKSTGIVRKIDELGRIVIPMELRKTLNIDIKDPLEIFVDEDKVILTKYEPSCIFCDSSKNMHTFNNKNICQECFDKLTEDIKSL